MTVKTCSGGDISDPASWGGSLPVVGDTATVNGATTGVFTFPCPTTIATGGVIGDCTFASTAALTGTAVVGNCIFMGTVSAIHATATFGVDCDFRGTVTCSKTTITLTRLGPTCNLRLTTNTILNLDCEVGSTIFGGMSGGTVTGHPTFTAGVTASNSTPIIYGGTIHNPTFKPSGISYAWQVITSSAAAVTILGDVAIYGNLYIKKDAAYALNLSGVTSVSLPGSSLATVTSSLSFSGTPTNMWPATLRISGGAFYTPEQIVLGSYTSQGVIGNQAIPAVGDVLRGEPANIIGSFGTLDVPPGRPLCVGG